jgi:hypothetical protein
VTLAELLLLSSTRPAPVKQPALPPWDPSDAGGIVHTTPPPELVIPKGYDNLFLRCDFNGITLDQARWGTPPVLVGANTTPVTMLMSPMLVLYPRYWQDAYLTEAAERNYSHIVIAADGWNLENNGYTPTPSKLVQWGQYLKSWGYRVILWRSMPELPDPFLDAMLSAGVLDWYIYGEEVDGKTNAMHYESDLFTLMDSIGIPIGAHFTSNYPSGWPRDTFLTDWSPFDGKVHLMWQADQNDSAGTQGARLYYARQRVNLGLIGDGSYSHPAPNSRVYAFETMATAQLYGKCDEGYGNLRGLELLYTTRDNPGILPVSGCGNGGTVYHDGTPM